MTGHAALNAQGGRVVLGEREILCGASLRLAPREITCVVGANGSGKSTLLLWLAGALRGEGQVELHGRDVSALPLHARARMGLGLLPQGAGVFGELSARQNLALAAELWLPRPERASAVEELLVRLHLERVAGLRAGHLSGGERRKVELGRLLVWRPSVLLLDEPLAALDDTSCRVVGELLQERAAQGAAVLLTEQRREWAERVASRGLALVDGQLRPYTLTGE